MIFPFPLSLRYHRLVGCSKVHGGLRGESILKHNLSMKIFMVGLTNGRPLPSVTIRSQMLSCSSAIGEPPGRPGRQLRPKQRVMPPSRYAWKSSITQRDDSDGSPSRPRTPAMDVPVNHLQSGLAIPFGQICQSWPAKASSFEMSAPARTQSWSSARKARKSHGHRRFVLHVSMRRPSPFGERY